MPSPIVAVVLAGGRARRMGGGDKPLRSLGGRALLDHVLERIRPQVAAVVLNANGDPSRFAAFGVPVVADTIAEQPGPLAGVLAGMRWAQAAFPHASDVVSVPGDTPFLPRDLVARLAAARAAIGQPIAWAASGGRVHPAVALWPVALADALDAAVRSGARRVSDWATTIGVAEAVLAADPIDPFFNINRPEDLAAAAAMLARS